MLGISDCGSRTAFIPFRTAARVMVSCACSAFCGFTAMGSYMPVGLAVEAVLQLVGCIMVLGQKEIVHCENVLLNHLVGYRGSEISC
jgi:hypothetical protein